MMSPSQFAFWCGFYTEEEVRDPGFGTLLRGIFPTARPEGITIEDIRAFWATIAWIDYSPKDAIETQIRDPVYRYIHRILASTLIARKSGTEKCNQIEVQSDRSVCHVLHDHWPRGQRCLDFPVLAEEEEADREGCVH